MTDPDSTPRLAQDAEVIRPDAVLALLEGHAAGHAGFGVLMRGLTLFDGWQTVAGPDGNVMTRLMEDGPWLDLFVDEERLQAHLERVPQDIDLQGITISGAFWASMDEGLAGVHIHPAQSHALQLAGGRRDEVRAWARTALIEAMVARRHVLDAAALRAWTGWQLLVRTSPAEDRPQLVLTADAEGRPVAAVFTADDCREAFLQRLPPATRAGMSVRVMKGVQLFAQLASLPIQGAAFNPAGPVPACGYDRPWLARVAQGSAAESHA